MADKSGFFIENIILKYESSIGLLEFRYISVKDLIFFRELNQTLSNKDFSIRAVSNQLEHIDIEKFSNLPENELKTIIEEYAQKSKLIFNHYSKIESKDVFFKFKKSILEYLQEERERMKILSQAISQKFEPIKKIIEQSNVFPRLFSQFSLPRIIIPKIEIPRLILSDISKQFSILNTSFLKIFQDQSKVWQNFAVQYKKISKKSLRKLKKYNWFINASMPSPFIAETAKVKNAKDMKQLFINYHVYDNFSTLNYYCVEWDKKPLFKKRMKILSDAITLFKSNYKNKNVNINNIIIPVLINQIEGIKHDYMKSKGFVYTRKNSYTDPKTNQNISWKKVFQDSLKNEDEFTKLIGTVFEKILFQEETDKVLIINFSRHKISHGVIIKYGTLETTVRCFMILEFLSELK